MSITLYLGCGPSGCGKSTELKRRLNETGGVYISRDVVRFNPLKDNEDYFAKEDEVFNDFCELIQQAIDEEKPIIYIDATHLNEKARNKVLNKLNLTNVDIIPISMNASLKNCLDRNAQRTGRALVPSNVVANMHRTFQPPTFKEKYKYKEIIFVNLEDELDGKNMVNVRLASSS